MYVANVNRRWSDMDALGHINNTAFLEYLQQARIEFLSEAAAAGVPREAGGLLVARNEIDYRQPMPYHREPVSVRMWTDRIGSTSFTFAYEVAEDDTVYARARTVLVCIDGRGRPTPVPTALKNYLEKFGKS